MDESVELQALLERIGNLLRHELRRSGAAHALQPVQIEALHYLSLCNRFSNTPQGVSEYLGLTKGTVSQTLKVLEARGLVRKTPDQEDRRVVHLCLTEAGRRALADSVPAELLRSAATRLSTGQRSAALAALRALLAGMQGANEGRTFGVCRSCQFHRVLSATHSRCQLLGVDLVREESGRICREFLAVA